MNPELQLNEVATAIKHRCISTTERWHIVYYHNRITCVPSYENVPPEIILAEFTEIMVERGFTVHEWHDIRNKIAWFYKELNP